MWRPERRLPRPASDREAGVSLCRTDLLALVHCREVRRGEGGSRSLTGTGGPLGRRGHGERNRFWWKAEFPLGHLSFEIKGKWIEQR